MKLPVYVLAVRDFQDRDNFLGIFDFVDHPVTPDSDSPARHVAQSSETRPVSGCPSTRQFWF